MARPKRDDVYLKVLPSYGRLIEEMLSNQEATIVESMQVKTLAKIRNNTGLFNITQPTQECMSKKIVKINDAEIVAKWQNHWVFRLL
jgi:hypothetical protein